MLRGQQQRIKYAKGVIDLGFKSLSADALLPTVLGPLVSVVPRYNP